MQLIIVCQVCNSELKVLSIQHNEKITGCHIFVPPCPKCAAQPLLALDNASLSAPDDTTGAFDESIIGALP